MSMFATETFLFNVLRCDRDNDTKRIISIEWNHCRQWQFRGMQQQQQQQQQITIYIELETDN